ncbi:MAG: 2-hydroxyacyl-CoA dehydratase family protein [Spirochaetes bacterium]|nr:2-hydroxyacyl-CoA dehydratase family protein [Spirochaetota bacterium]
MRQALKQYNFDWMLWRTYLAGSRLQSGTQNEYALALQYIPYFREPVMQIFKTKAGQLFLEMVALYLDNIVNAHARGKKTCMTTFCFSPAILYALDIVPVTLEVLSVMMTFLYKRGTAEFLDYCNEAGFTETSCSSQRGSMGAYLAGIGAPIDMVVTDSPGVCDTNANAFAFFAAYKDVPFFQLNMPPWLVEERVTRYHVEDYKALVQFLEEQSGRKLEDDTLQQILLELHKQDELINILEQYLCYKPLPLPVTTCLFIYAGRFMFAGMPIYTKLLEMLVEEGKENVMLQKQGLYQALEKVRGFFCYIDHYTHSLRLWQMLDELGIGYSGNILSHFWADSNPPVVKYNCREAAYSIKTDTRDDMLVSIAAINSRMPMIKSIRGPYDLPYMWLEDTLALARLYNADFIVYNGTPGCRNTWGMVKLLAQDTEKAGFPTHIMYADAFDDRVQSWESTRDRFEEFLRVRRLI